MLSTDTVKVVPADFGPDKSVTKTIKNTHTPKETPKKDTPKKGSSPKTGDENNLGHYAVVLIASSMILAAVAAKKAQKRSVANSIARHSALL